MASAMDGRAKGASLLATGLLCWGINLTLALTLGMFGPTLVIFGALLIFLGAVQVLWGDSFRTMPPAQKIPAALIALSVVVGVAIAVLRMGQTLR